MKKQLLIPGLILLMTLSLSVKANEDFEGNYPEPSDYTTEETGEMSHEDFEGEHPQPPEGWSGDESSYSEENWSEEYSEENYDMPEPPDHGRILEIVEKINAVYEAMRAELEEYHSKTLKKATNKLDHCIDMFSEVMLEEDNERPKDCHSAIKKGFRIFNRTITLMEQRICKPEQVNKQCIPVEIADKYIPQLKELYAELEAEVLKDEDEDGTPDVCKHFEEWEDENWEDREPPKPPDEVQIQ